MRGRRRETSRAVGNGSRLVTIGEGCARVEGPLDFDSISHLLSAGEALLSRSGPLRIDLGGVTTANSAGLALLLEWMDLARSRGVDIVYTNVPESLQRIAAFSNLAALLPVAEVPVVEVPVTEVRM